MHLKEIGKIKTYFWLTNLSFCFGLSALVEPFIVFCSGDLLCAVSREILGIPVNHVVWLNIKLSLNCFDWFSRLCFCFDRSKIDPLALLVLVPDRSTWQNLWFTTPIAKLTSKTALAQRMPTNVWPIKSNWKTFSENGKK
jgi:hypothetical protein